MDGDAPRFLLRDRDDKFGSPFDRVAKAALEHLHVVVGMDLGRAPVGHIEVRIRRRLHVQPLFALVHLAWHAPRRPVYARARDLATPRFRLPTDFQEVGAESLAREPALAHVRHLHPARLLQSRNL